MEFFNNNVWEIKKSNSLKFLGGTLALFHLAQFYFWFQEGMAPLKYAQESIPLCRSIFETCQWIRIFPYGVLEGLFYLYAVLALVSALAFLLTSFTGLGFWTLLFSWVCGGLLYFQDLRLSTNENFLILFLTITFLLVPSKSRYARWIVVSFIAASGLAKMSPDWLTGVWFVQHINVPIKLGEWLAAVCLVVELIASAALLLRDGRFFVTGWISLLAMQALMIFVGELFAPIINIALLVFIALQELEIRKVEREYIYQSFIRPEPSFIVGGSLLVIFWIAQLLPFANIDQRSAVGSTFDLFALHPLAAHEECSQKTYAVYNRQTEQIKLDLDTARVATMKCNVYLRYLDLKAVCQKLKETRPDFVTISSILEIKSLRTQEVRRAFEVKDFCQSDLTFKKLSDQKWNSEKVN